MEPVCDAAEQEGCKCLNRVRGQTLGPGLKFERGRNLASLNELAGIVLQGQEVCGVPVLPLV